MKNIAALSSPLSTSLRPHAGPSGSRPYRLRRSVAVLAGLVTVVGLSTGTDAIMHGLGVFPQPGVPMSAGLFLLATLYRSAYGIFGSYLAARLAPNRPMAHALVLGGIGFAASALGVLATLGRGPEFGPLWYPLALVLLALPDAWLGGRLFSMQRQQSVG
jgi:hypothetical protein